MQNPPPPPPPPGQPPMMPPGAAAPMAMPGNLASPGLRIVGGLIDVVILGVIGGLVSAVSRGNYGLSGFVGLVITLAYLGYFWSSQGRSIGMMVFGFRVRDALTGADITLGKALLRAFVWWLELILTPVCLIGFVGWGWQLWDARRQAIHDKVASTVVTTA